MPKLNGFELMSIIRRLPEHENTPVIFITGDGTVNRLLGAVNTGASDFIVKPFDVDVLRDKVAKHLS
jgi:two-component system chemotaxis response regulator CheY